MRTISPTRLYLLSACYLVVSAGLAVEVAPDLFGPAVTMPLIDGAVVAMLSALSILSAVGLLVPLRMLPLLIFELVWKLIWILSVGLPRTLIGTADKDVVEMMLSVSVAIPFVFIVPWQWVGSGFRSSLDPWRPSNGI